MKYAILHIPSGNYVCNGSDRKNTLISTKKHLEYVLDVQFSDDWTNNCPGKYMMCFISYDGQPYVPQRSEFEIVEIN
jgi:hypothetical protein